MLCLMGLTLVGACWLISPVRNLSFPGQIPWRAGSLLRPLTEALSLGHLLETVRGAEIKEVVAYSAATLGLTLLALRFLLRRHDVHFNRDARQSWLHAQLFLMFWVGVSFWSARWSGAPDLAIGQSAIYALQLAWALALGWNLQGHHLSAARWLLTGVPTVAAALCAWYFFERNPNHRPGFPMGNPATLAASILPAFLLGLVQLGLALGEWRTSGLSRGVVKRISLAGLVLLACGMCMALTRSRSTLLGLAVSLGVLGLVRLPKRGRWVLGLVGVVGLAWTGLWLAQSGSQVLDHARGATIRYRLYTWRYAAELWQTRPTMGLGAGAFPRMAGDLAALDRALDPGAFLGEIISHAHNEMFEIFAEIGLLGGVLWVGGMLATGLCGLRILRAAKSAVEYWSAAALLAAFVGLFVDGMASAGLRLPGLPTVMFSVVGLLWAHARAVTRAEVSDLFDLIDAQDRPRSWRTPALGAACALAAVGCGIATWRNTAGLVAETRAQFAMNESSFQRAETESERAGRLLLDPVRKLYAMDLATRAALRQAAAEFGRLHSATTQSTSSDADLQGGAMQIAWVAALRASNTSTQLLRIAPGWPRSAAYVAQASELQANLARRQGAADAAQWMRQAHAAWQLQRRWLPYDFLTLMRLVQYPGTTDMHLLALRDALRSDDFEPASWKARLAELDAAQDFEVNLMRLEQAVGPLTAGTDLDTLVVSMAPETHRLVGAWHALHGRYEQAANAAAAAAELYEPMQARFPVMRARALAEQAEYRFSLNPDSPGACIGLALDAIAALPPIQPQQFDELAQPFREALIGYLLAAGRDADAAKALEQILHEEDGMDLRREFATRLVRLAQSLIQRTSGHREAAVRWLDRAQQLDPANLGAWSWLAWVAAESGEPQRVDALLRAALESGLSPDQIQRIRRSLSEFFPTINAFPSTQPSPP